MNIVRRYGWYWDFWYGGGSNYNNNNKVIDIIGPIAYYKYIWVVLENAYIINSERTVVSGRNPEVLGKNSLSESYFIVCPYKSYF